jgi:tRNA G10  N-methylase Trm11
MPDLDFTARNTLYATHGLHAYAAKCPPQLVAYGLRYYSEPGEMVLDPMAGSGTTLVEARLMGRHAVGYDLDPLARMIARVKSRQVHDSQIESACEVITRRVDADLQALKKRSISAALRARATPPDFTNVDYWFEPTVAAALAVLAYHISRARVPAHVRNFFWVAFSSLILAKTSVANALDIIHSRHHHCPHEKTPDVLARFALRVRQMRRRMADFRERCRLVPLETTSTVRPGDARSLRVRSESVDLVFTSPPYATALDYPRAHFLAVAWMRQALGVSLEDYRALGPAYIGSERGRTGRGFTPDPRLARFETASAVLEQVGGRSARQAALLQRYFADMGRVFRQTARVLKSDRHAVVVICPSHIRKVPIPTHEVFAELARAHHLRLKRRLQRTISVRRRILPYMRETFGQRMETEYVLVFQKKS